MSETPEDIARRLETAVQACCKAQGKARAHRLARELGESEPPPRAGFYTMPLRVPIGHVKGKD